MQALLLRSSRLAVHRIQDSRESSRDPGSPVSMFFSRRNPCLTDVHSTFGLFFLPPCPRPRAYARREQVIGDDRSRSVLVVISRTTSVRQFPRRDSLPLLGCTIPASAPARARGPIRFASCWRRSLSRRPYRAHARGPKRFLPSSGISPLGGISAVPDWAYFSPDGGSAWNRLRPETAQQCLGWCLVLLTVCRKSPSSLHGTPCPSGPSSRNRLVHLGSIGR